MGWGGGVYRVLPDGGVCGSPAPLCVCLFGVCDVGLWASVCVFVCGGGGGTCKSLTVASVEVIDHQQLLPEVLVDDFRGTRTLVLPQHVGHTLQRFVDLSETFKIASINVYDQLYMFTKKFVACEDLEWGLRSASIPSLPKSC